MKYSKPEKPKKPTSKELTTQIHSLRDALDGAIMRSQAFEAKANALEKNVHALQKRAQQLAAQADAADRLATKLVRIGLYAQRDWLTEELESKNLPEIKGSDPEETWGS
jgi:predicted RNase H-like nuclease (RuvC/YqgF family)